MAFISSYGQTDAAKYSGISGYGFRYKRFAMDSVAMLPLATSTHIPYRAGAVRYNENDSALEVYTGAQWIKENKAVQLTDSTFKVGRDTIRIRGTGSGSGTSVANASGAGDTLWTGAAVKRIDHDATLTISTNSNKLLLAADTISYVASISKLRDTAAALRAAIGTGGGATNLDTTRTSTSVTVLSSTGNDAVIPAADTTNRAGVLTVVDKRKIDDMPKLFNVIRYGAKPDGKERYDGVMTSGSPTLTCSSCSFTSADVGKSIRVDGAVTGGDLVTTIIGYSNSSTVTLGANATRSVSADTLVFGTDNTPMIQAAIDAAAVAGDAKVYVPAGIYVLAGPLVTSFEGANPNAQLVWKTSVYGTPSFLERKWFSIEGAADMNPAPSTFGDSVCPFYGSILYSIINGSGTLPSVFGTRSNGGSFGDFNYNSVSFKNLTIMVARNNKAGGPSVGGINGLFCGSMRLENLYIGVSGSIKRQPQPIYDVAGVIIGKISSEIYNSVKNVSTYAFKYGFIYAEGVTIDHATAHASVFAHTFANCITPVEAGMITAMWSQNSIYVPNHNLFGLIPSGTTYFNIHTLAGELFNGSTTGAPAWLDRQYVINDSGSLGRGSIASYALGQAEVGGGNALFNKYGGDSIYTRLSGSRVDPNVRTFTNEIKANSSFIFGGTAGGASNYLYNLSGLTNSSILRVQPTVTNGTQIMSLAPSGTGDAVLSPIMSAFNMYNTSLGTGFPITGNANTERLTFAAVGTKYKISSEIEGTGSHRPITFETGGIANQFKLNTTGEVEVNGTASDQFKVLGNSAFGRTSIYLQNASSTGNASMLIDNDRGSLAAHGGFLTGGQSFGSSFFGVSCADKTMLYHGGGSGGGLLLGTLNNTPLIIGTNNTEQMRISSAGKVSLQTVDSAGSPANMLWIDPVTKEVKKAAVPSGGDGNGIYGGSGTLSGTTTVNGGGTSSLLLGASGSKLGGFTVYSASNINLYGAITYNVDGVTTDANHTVPAAIAIVEVTDNLTTNRTFTMPTPSQQGQTLTVIMKFSAGSNHFSLASAITDNSTGSTFTQLDWGKTYDFYVDAGVTWRLIRKY
jgi:hypothetical protein